MRRGDPGQGGQQHVQTFARLVDTTDEEQRRVLSRVAGKRCGALIVRTHDSVGDEDGIAAQVLDQRLAGRFAHRDAGRDLLHRGLHQVVGRRQCPRALLGTVPGGDHRPPRGPTGKNTQGRRGRFVHVQHIEVAFLDPAPNPGGRHRTEVHLGDRAVVRHRDRFAPVDDERLEWVLGVVNRRKHADVVAEAAQSDRKVVDVGLDTAGRGPVIGADDAYLHCRRRGSRSARNTGCSMCQCCGWVAIPSAS